MAGAFLSSICVSGFGEAAASGQLSFYAVGTLTPAVIYSDDALSQAVTQPIILTAEGKSPGALYSATPLRAIVNTSSGATLMDIERVDGDRAELVRVQNPNWTQTNLNDILTALAGSLGGPNGQFQDAGAGSVARPENAKFEEVQVSVKDFGAVGNGVANDTTAIQAAVNRIIALGGGTVFFPPGTYNISSAIALAMGATALSVQLDGAGQLVSRIVQTSATANTITVTGGAGTGLVSLTDIGLNATSTSGIALQGVSTLSIVASNVLVTGHESGFTNVNAGENSNGQTCLFTNVSIACRSTSAGVGVSGEMNGTTMVGCLILCPAAAAGFIGISFTASTTVTTSPVFSSFGTTVYLNSATGKCVNIAAPCPSGGVFFQGGGLYGGASPTATIAAAITTYVQLPTYVDVGDSRTAGVAAIAFSGNGNFSPIAGFPMRIIQNTAATTVTVNGVVPANHHLMGTRVDLMCINSSGGAVTWTFAAAFKLSGAVAPATGNCTAISFLFDSISVAFREVARATAAI